MFHVQQRLAHDVLLCTLKWQIFNSMITRNISKTYSVDSVMSQIYVSIRIVRFTRLLLSTGIHERLIVRMRRNFSSRGHKICRFHILYRDNVYRSNFTQRHVAKFLRWFTARRSSWRGEKASSSKWIIRLHFINNYDNQLVWSQCLHTKTFINSDNTLRRASTRQK